MLITPAFAQASGGFGSGIGGFLPIILISLLDRPAKASLKTAEA